MQKTSFKNDIFYWLLLAYLVLLISWNAYALFLGQIFALLPVSLQLALFFLIFKKHKLAKTGISIWAILLMIGPGLSILGKSLKIITGDSFSLQLPQLLESFLFLLIGICILLFNRKTVVLQNSEETKQTKVT